MKIVNVSEVQAQLSESIVRQLAQSKLSLGDAERTVQSSVLQKSLAQLFGEEEAKSLGESVISAARGYGSNVAACRVLHPHTFITFVAEESFKRVVAMRPADLDNLVPAFAERVANDACFSINGLYGDWRTSSLVSHLTCIFVDVDFREDTTASRIESRISSLRRLVAAGELPDWTILGRLGRGIWLFWCLREADLDQAVKRSRETGALWLRLQKAVSGRLNLLGVPIDRAASTDLAQLTRLPGSLNSKAYTEVQYYVTFGLDGRPIHYTMSELASLFGVPQVLPPFVEARVLSAVGASGQTVRAAHDSSPRHDSRRAKGWRALNQRRRDLELLLEMRGGKFREACRNHAAVMFRVLTRGLGLEYEKSVEQFGRECCEPPLSPAEIREAVKAFRARRARFTDWTIGVWFQITTAESQHLAGDYLPAPRIRAHGSWSVGAKFRRELISEICRTGQVPPLRQIAKELWSRGIECSPKTVERDLKVLRIKNPRGASSW
jgi:hypothetical protein